MFGVTEYFNEKAGMHPGLVLSPNLLSVLMSEVTKKGKAPSCL